MEYKYIKFGKNFIVDDGKTLDFYKSFLKENSHFFDYVKFLNGSAILLPNLKKKINLLKKYKKKAFCGGTLFEKFYFKKKLNDYFKFLDQNKFEAIEISSGTINVPLEDRISFVKKLSKKFTIFFEIGSKVHDLSDETWLKEIEIAFSVGTDFIILEGRLANNKGIYKSDGSLNNVLIEKIIKKFNKKKIFFEASSVDAQISLLKKFGKDINIGNIFFEDVIKLETIRNSLKSETFYL